MHGVSAVSNDPNAVRKMYADIVGLEQAMKRVDVSPGMLSWAACGCFKGQWSFDDVYICLSCLATQMPMAGEPKSSSTIGPGAALILASEKFGTLAGPGKALLKYRPLRHTHTHTQNPQFESLFYLFFQLPTANQLSGVGGARDSMSRTDLSACVSPLFWKTLMICTYWTMVPMDASSRSI